jgi:tetratricopeptide (TPR) repeat protein
LEASPLEFKALPPLPEPPPQPVAARPDDLYAEALDLLGQGQGAEALERLHHIMEIDPDFARAYYLVAKIRADAGLWREAQDWCQRALERDTLLAEAHFLLALIYSQEGDPSQALQAMKRVVYLRRDVALGHFWLANLYTELGDGTRAHKSLENTARLLAGVPAETLLPWSDGMMAGRLRYIVGRRLNE